MFGLFVLFVYETFRLSHQEDDATGGLCSKFDSDLRRKIVVLDEFRVTRLMNTGGFHFKDQAGTISCNTQLSQPLPWSQ